jgi:hypothetical protein
MKIYAKIQILSFFSFSLDVNNEEDNRKRAIEILKDVKDINQLFEKMLCENDENFPIVMDFLKSNGKINVTVMHNELGYSFINSNCDVNDSYIKWKLINNLNYLKMNSCDLDRELFFFLHSLTFGGKIVQRGKHYLDLVKILIPFVTDFFTNQTYWKKIRYFSHTKEMIEVLHFLLQNYGSEKIFPILPPPFTEYKKYGPFTLKHLARNKLREILWNEKKVNHTMISICDEDLPRQLYKYLMFV